MELVCTKKVDLDDVLECKNNELNLEYYLLSCENENSSTYGIQIIMTKNNGESEIAVINDVLSSRTSMIELIKLFYSNSVTPVSAYEVIYDYIA
jgi:hypothetical protein